VGDEGDLDADEPVPEAAAVELPPGTGTTGAEGTTGTMGVAVGTTGVTEERVSMCDTRCEVQNVDLPAGALTGTEGATTGADETAMGEGRLTGGTTVAGGAWI
jgi:hypothetical protein